MIDEVECSGRVWPFGDAILGVTCEILAFEVSILFKLLQEIVMTSCLLVCLYKTRWTMLLLCLLLTN